ncbi:DMT family transporter [bacterium]|nr:DMT family transporter [bacterium]
MSDQRKALLFGLAAVLAWSTVATAFKLTLRHIDFIQLLWLANVFSLGALGLVLAVQKKLGLLLRVSGPQLRLACALGFLNPFLYYLILFKGYDLLPAQVAQPLNFTWALMLAYLSVPLLGQKLRARDVTAGLVCYTGVVVISTGGDVTSFRFADPLGLVLILITTVIWALYWIGNTRSTVDPVTGLFIGFAFSLPLITAVTAVFSDFRFPAAGWWGGAYAGCIEMGFTFVLWLTAMKLTTSTARIANLIFISPFLSLVFIQFVLDEPVRPATFIGLILIVAGLWWQGRREKP